MMLILEDLWRGKITPSERRIAPNSRYQKIMRQAVEEERKLMPILPKEGKEIFRAYDDCQLSLTDIAEQEAFIQGVQIGARIVMDVLCAYPFELPQILKGKENS